MENEAGAGNPAGDLAWNGASANPENQVSDGSQERDDSIKKIKCRGCGATEVVFNPDRGVFVCDFCRTETAPETATVGKITGDIQEIKEKEGFTISPGLDDAAPREVECLSFHCPSCKATLTVGNETDVGGLKCHWCRHQIAIADKVTGGIRPDGVIPFVLTKEQAAAEVTKYLKRRRLFSCREFVQTFKPEMIKPVFLPYILTRVRSECAIGGDAAIRIRSYTVGSKNSKKKYYDYDLYRFWRRFKISTNNLLIEAHSSYYVPPGVCPSIGTKNIINSIQPFNTEAIVDYTPKFLNGDFRAEFRDLNLDETMRSTIESRIKDIMVHNTLPSLAQYSHGYDIQFVSAQKEAGKYSSILAPAWLYSYRDQNGEISYICVNAQTGKCAASIPLNKVRLWVGTLIMQALAILGFVLLFFIL
ncbi:MAG: hypothetical protein LBC96_06030 [Lachnospiraceae bacterium]|jgi:ribosomal protein S27E|nr:hypothetical protein [Lachnospiraceae bacterium]